MICLLESGKTCQIKGRWSVIHMLQTHIYTISRTLSISHPNHIVYPQIGLFPNAKGCHLWKLINDIMFGNLKAIEYLILTFKHHQMCWFWTHLFKIETWMYFFVVEILISILIWFVSIVIPAVCYSDLLWAKAWLAQGWAWVTLTHKQ